MSTRAIILTTVAMLTTGCGGNPFPSTGPVVAKHTGSEIIRQEIDGHVYFTFTEGGIIHSQSCTNTACVRPATVDATSVIYRQGPHWIKDTPRLTP